MQALDIESQVREPAKKLAVKGTHGFPPLVQFIVGEEATGVPERLHDGVEVMGILDAEMVLYCLDACCTLAVAEWGHHLPPLRCASRCLGLKQAHAQSVSARLWHMSQIMRPHQISVRETSSGKSSPRDIFPSAYGCVLWCARGFAFRLGQDRRGHVWCSYWTIAIDRSLA